MWGLSLTMLDRHIQLVVALEVEAELLVLDQVVDKLALQAVEDSRSLHLLLKHGQDRHPFLDHHQCVALVVPSRQVTRPFTVHRMLVENTEKLLLALLEDPRTICEFCRNDLGPLQSPLCFRWWHLMCCVPLLLCQGHPYHQEFLTSIARPSSGFSAACT